MSLVVMKFGGSSVATAESRAAAISHIKKELELGNQVVVVVSAMGRRGDPYATDTLLSLVKGSDPLMKDLVSSCGETISACVFADELIENGVPAKPFTGESAHILTDGTFGKASVTAIETEPIRETLAQGIVPVITGFQGRTSEGETTTLGRGGSDTSAALIGGYLQADVVDIYTDVPGIARADPRIVPGAAFMDSISQHDMKTLAEWGSLVIHPKAIQAAIDFDVPLLRVRSTFDDEPGTAIGREDTNGFAGIAVLKDPVNIPEDELDFVKQLPDDYTVITAVCHDGTEPELCEEMPVMRRGDVLHIGVAKAKTAETANKPYNKYIGG